MWAYIDQKLSKRYSFRKQLKSLALRFAQKKSFDYAAIERFLLEVRS
jgi:hypothetical protein